MKTIDIEDQIYDFLLRNSVRIGETASEILWRLLNLDDSKNEIETNSEISEYLRSSSFKAHRKAIDKFMGILSNLHGTDPENFKKVLKLKGRNRKYFALSRDELENSGRSVQPRRIPDSNYWVITNNDTPKKRRMLEDVLHILGYGKSPIKDARNHLT